MSEKCVYIILLNYNNWHDTIASAESILKSEYRNFRLIIVDNASANGSVDQIRMWAEGRLSNWTPPAHPLRDLSTPPVDKPLDFAFLKEKELAERSPLPDNKVILILSRQNRGYSAGNNIGINFAKRCGDFDYIWILNNDTLITPQTLPRLVACSLRQKSEKMLLGTTLLYYDETDKIQAYGGRFNPLLAIPSHNLPHQPFERLTRKKYHDLHIDYLIGASMFLNQSVIDHIGKMPEEYFIYFEEIDIATNCRRHGFDIAICDEAIVYHKESASIDAEDRRMSAFSDFFALRNRLLFTRKYYPLFLPTVYIGLLLSLALRLYRNNRSDVYSILRILATSPKKLEHLSYKRLPKSLAPKKTL